MSSSEDSYDYEDYRLVCYEEDEEPSLMEKRCRLIAAVVQNQVDVLKELLDSPKWYNVMNKNGYSLLQIAIQENSEEVFDYMLSIPEFPFEFVNKYKQTALMVALSSVTDSQHFAYELVKKGASIDFVCYNGNTPLLCALYSSYDKVALLLIKMGVDLNVCNDKGDTPISLAVKMAKCGPDTEILAALLVEGAVPSIKNFEKSVLYDYPLIIQEILFLHTFDQYSVIDFYVLFKLAERKWRTGKTKSPILDEIIKCSSQIIISDRNVYPSYIDLCLIETDYLKLIVQKFGTFVAEVIHHNSRWVWQDHPCFIIESLNVLLESEFKFDIIDLIGRMNARSLFDYYMFRFCYNDSDMSGVYLYLLSYGLVLHELDLQILYHKFGNCELFKLFLHMDIEQSLEEVHNKDVMAVFLYDVKMNLQRFLENPEKFDCNSIHQLYDYFVHPGLTELYNRLTREDRIPKRDKMAHVPCLLELARNSFRNYFIDTFKIETAGKFYTLLKHLPISTVYKKIISYETKLY